MLEGMDSPDATARTCTSTDCEQPITNPSSLAKYCSQRCKQRENTRAYRQRNPRVARDVMRKARERDPERYAAYVANWRRKNPERAREINRTSWNKNKDKYNEARRGDPVTAQQMRDWQKANPAKIREYNRRRKARSKGASGRHTEDELVALWARYGGLCAYCGEQAEHADHVMPLSKGGSDDIENIAPACIACNLSKKDKAPDLWYSELVAKQS